MTYLPVNDTPTGAQGPNKREWRQFVGKYVGTFIGETTEATISIKGGNLYLNNELKLTEQAAGLFLTADGEAVVFENGGLLAGNRHYLKKK